MKRRQFIGLLGASSLSLPFLSGELGLGLGRHNTRPAASKSKIPLRLKLPKDLTELSNLLGQASKGVYLLGGTALAVAAGVDAPYVNLLIDSQKLSELKKGLFDFGVTPVSTADLPAHFVRFIYQDRAYNVLNMDIEAYLQMSMTGQENGLILFAHNFLVYSIKEAFALDPYGALGAKTADGKSFLIKPLQQPRTLVQGFEHCLAATFDRALLGLKASPEYDRIEERVLQSSPSAKDSKQIFSRVLDYTSDILEVGGLDTAARLLTSPVCVAAGKSAAEIDFTVVEADLRGLQRKGVEVTGREFMLSLHGALKKKTTGPGAAQGLPEYFLANKEQFRRIEVLVEAMEAASV